jgi:hypothetical protein
MDGSPSETSLRTLEGLVNAGFVDEKICISSGDSMQVNEERYPEFGAELARLEVDLLLVTSAQAARAAMEATQTIPIVFVSPVAPVER